MSKPIVNKIIPFDAGFDYKISMSYNGNLPYSNRIIIYDATTLSVVFDDTVTAFSLEHTIPSDTLINGKKYAIQGQVFDSNGNPSALSDKSYFWCLETPSFYFENLANGQIINNASIYANLIYEQSNGETISEYKFYLYDDVKIPLLESEVFYSVDNLNYAYRGLDDDKFYYIRAVGVTTNGITLDTGYIQIFVDYEIPDEYKLIYVECNNHNSVVTYQTNFKVVNSSGSNTYEYDDGFINLDDDVLVYDEGFVINGDFTMSLCGKFMYKNGIILRASNEKYGFVLTSYIYDDNSMRIKLSAPNGLCNYILYSEPLFITNDDIITIHIRRINNLYKLVCFVGGK